MPPEPQIVINFGPGPARLYGEYSVLTETVLPTAAQDAAAT